MNQGEITLPPPDRDGKISLEKALSERESVREYRDEPLTLKEISQILWSAQGVTREGGRTTPSAGATYPLEIYLVARKVESLEIGVYRYLPTGHGLRMVVPEDVSSKLAQAALGQSFVKEAPVNLVFTAIYGRTTRRYGERGIGYVQMEVGHAAQNVYLQARSLGLGTVVVGAFDDRKIQGILNLSGEEKPLCLMPVGRR